MTQDMRTGPVRGKKPGVAAIDYNGARYCLDCAARVLDGESFSVEKNGSWESVSNANGQEIVDGLVGDDIYTLSDGGVVHRHGINDGDDHHCMLDANCANALGPDEHKYDHDKPVGVKLDV